jgi:hypothetical protein
MDDHAHDGVLLFIGMNWGFVRQMKPLRRGSHGLMHEWRKRRLIDTFGICSGKDE